MAHSKVEFNLRDGYTIGDWVLVLQCLDEEGKERVVLQFPDSISATTQYGLLGQGFDQLREHLASQGWERDE